MAIEKAAPTLIPLIEAARQAREAERLRWEAQVREHERAARVRRRQEAQKASHDELVAIIEAWSRAQGIVHFLKDAEQHIHSADSTDREGLLARLAAAREMLGDLNALHRLREWKTPRERTKTGDWDDVNAVDDTDHSENRDDA